MRLPMRVLATIVATIAASETFAHGGGLDGYGCHNNRKAGGYHCHQGPYAGMSFSSKEEALQYFNSSGSSAQPLYSAPSTPSQPSSDLSAVTDRLKIKTAQKLLTTLGYYNGPADGVMGAKTRNAVVAFQTVNGLPADGNVSDDLLNRLTVEVAEQ